MGERNRGNTDAVGGSRARLPFPFTSDAPAAPAGDPLALASALLAQAAGLAPDDARREALTAAARALLAPPPAVQAAPVVPLRRVGP